MALLSRRSACALLAAVGLVVTAWPAAAAPGQASPPAVGLAKSSAYGLRLAPSIGGTALTMTFGGAGAQLQNAAGTGIAATADLGLLGTVFANGVCGAKLPLGFLPQPTLVTNSKGDASGHADVVPLGALGGVGTQDVSATAEPRVQADVRLASLDLQQAVRVGAVTASARTFNEGGSTPVGEATVETNVDIPGLLSLRALRWEVRQKGAAPGGGTGTFTFAGGTVLGVPIAAGDVGAAAGSINVLLAPLGLRVTMPTFTHEDGDTPISRMSPLIIGFIGSPVLNTVLDPLLGLTRTFKEQLVAALSANCFTSYGGLLADLALGLVVGTGQLNILIGGAEVSTNDDAFVDPFGGQHPVPPGGSTIPPAPVGLPFHPGSVAPPALPPAAVPPPPQVRGGPLATVCETVHPNGSPGCSDGDAAAAGGVILTGSLVAAVADLRMRRRRQGGAT